MDIKDENWLYCSLCQTVAYSFDCCRGTTCNGAGGGCEGQCKDIYFECVRRISAGEHPDMEVLESNGNKIASEMTEKEAELLQAIYDHST